MMRGDLMFRRDFIPVLVALCALSLVDWVNAQPTSFQGIGGLAAGGSSSRVVGVSAGGDFVAGWGVSSNSSGAGPVTTAALRWTEQSGSLNLGDLPDKTVASEAAGISGDGSTVVGRGNVPKDLAAMGAEAFRWTSSTGIVGLGDLPGGKFTSFAAATSTDGSVIVGGSNSEFGSEAFRWTSATGMVGIGDLPDGSFASRAAGISGDGSVIVGTGSSSQGMEAFRWTSTTGMVGLGDLPGGVFGSSAADISADGHTIVGTGVSNSGVVAFRWTKTTGMQSLGDLRGGFVLSDAFGVSGDGSQVVGSSNSSEGAEAFVWDSVRGMRSVKDVLIHDYNLGDSLADWQLQTATDISDDGMTLVGNGINPLGNREGWVAQLRGEFVPGDANFDGRVDLTDFSILKTNFASGKFRDQGDFNSDGKVDLSDFSLLKDNFGISPNLGGSVMQAVPEPGTLLLCLLGGSILVVWRWSFGGPSVSALGR